jgi:O-antigen ligase/Flp pilus assembly protein TadD
MAWLSSLITTFYHGLLLLTPFVFTWVNSELFQFNKMLVVYAAAVIIGSLWIARMIVEKKIIWQKHPLSLLVLVFLGSQLISTILSIHFRTSLLGYYSRLNGGLLSSLAYTVLVLGLINNVPKKQAFRLLLTSLIAGLLISLYALPEHFGVSPSCYLMFQELSVDCWKQDVQARVFATFGQPNWLAAYLISLLPIAWLFIQKNVAKLSWLWTAGLGLMLLIVWYTGSRSGLLAVVTMIATWLAIQHRVVIGRWFKKSWKKNQTRLGLLIGASALAIGSLFFAYRWFNSLPQTYDLSQGTESGSIRLIVWRGALKVWQRYPWFGSGPGTFGYSYYQDRPVQHNLTSEWDNLYNKAHNELLNYLAETGLVGTLAYLALVGGAIWLLYQQLPKSSSKPTISLAVIVSLVGLSVTHLLGFSTVMTNLLLFILPAIALLEKNAGKIKAADWQDWWQKVALGLLAIIGLLLLNNIIRFWLADYHYAQAEKLQSRYQYSTALTKLQQANQLLPKEPLYYDELANLYAKLSLQYALVEELEASQQLTKAAIQNSDYALILNPRHLNFYKTRARVFLLLAQSDKQYYRQAENTLEAALKLSPTDAQLWYNLGIVQQALGKFGEAVQTLEHTVEIKPNYPKARVELGDLLIQLGQVEAGKNQYRFILENLASNDEEVRQKLLELANDRENIQ